MRYQHRLTGALFAGLMSLSSAGCLSVGGKTYTTESPSLETTQRISALETRVGVLERALLAAPQPAGAPVPLEIPPGTPPPAGPYVPGAPPPRASFAPYITPVSPPR
jgi:hypothetical protein